MSRKIDSLYVISLVTGASLSLNLLGDSFLSSENRQYDASNDILSSRNWQYDASNDVLSSENNQESGSRMPATMSYCQGMFCFLITQSWAAVRTLVLKSH